MNLFSIASLHRKSQKRFVASLAAFVFAAATPLSQSAVLVYRTEFQKIEESVNYPKPSFGYFFIDPDAGSVTSVTVLVNPFTGEAYYSSSLLSGSYFQATPYLGKTPTIVISASSGSTGSDQTFLQISGLASKKQSLGGSTSLYPISSKLFGYILLSGSDQSLPTDTSSTSSSTSNTSSSTATPTATATATPTPTATPTSSTTTSTTSLITTAQEIDAELGYVGYTKVTAKFQRLYTRTANINAQSAADVSASIIKTLEAMGIKAADSSSSSSSTSTTSTTTTSPTPTPTPTSSPTATPSS